LQSVYTQILPKAVPGLISDLLSREGNYHKSPEDAPMYTIEVFTKKGGQILNKPKDTDLKKLE